MKAIEEVTENGFTVITNIYTKDEISELLLSIEKADSGKETFRKSNDLFAIRQFLKEVPSAAGIIFNARLKTVLNEVFGETYFVVKSIYFDKPPASNWYVAWHQDLTISVDKKLPVPGFNNWTAKHNQFAVQPTLAVLENVVTVRIHLDDTDEHNGALRVIPGSHLKGVYRPETIDWTTEKEVSCNISKGGIMLMKPLLLHSSGRTTNNHQRRVIHLEFSSIELPAELQWAERLDIDQ